MTSSCGHAHDHTGGLSGAGLAAELAQAETRCAADGQKLTAARRRVLEMLLHAGQPAKAYDLMSGFEPGGAAAKPPTVYRALEFLERHGFVHRIESLNAYVACRHDGQAHQAAFLICDCCGATREVEPSASPGLSKQAAAAAFAISGVTIEAHGLCADCQSA